jgi:hypothetical protein
MFGCGGNVVWEADPHRTPSPDHQKIYVSLALSAFETSAVYESNFFVFKKISQSTLHLIE